MANQGSQPTRGQMLGDWLRETREAQQPPVPVDEVARALGVTATEYEQWEQGGAPMPFGADRFDALGRAYGWDDEARAASAASLGRRIVGRVLGEEL